MGSARHFWSLLSSLGGVALHPWSTLSPYLGMFGDLGWLVGSLWLCLAVIFVHTMSACAGRSAALSRDQMQMLDSLCLSLLSQGKDLQVGFCPWSSSWTSIIIYIWEVCWAFGLHQSFHYLGITTHPIIYQLFLCCALYFSVNFLLTAD